MMPRLVLVVVGSAFCAVALAAEGGSARLSKIEGQVWTRPVGSQEAPAVANSTVPLGTQVRTGADGAAEISFEDGSVLRMQKSSSILLSPSKRQKQKSSVLLFFGRIWNKVSPSGTGETSYEVSTPNAVCGVRGTQFEAQVGDDGSLRMQVTEGKVAVDGGSGDQVASPGQQVEANEQGVEPTESSSGQESYDKWQSEKRERIRTQGESIVKAIKGKIMSKKDKLEALLSRQKELESSRKGAEERARSGERAAIDEIKRMNAELAEIADAMADLGDEASAQIGIVDHFADLANDPRFKMIGRKMIEAEAASLRRIKADLDKMVADGTDISIEAMDKMMDDMSKGKPTLRDDKGSAGKDLFGDDPMDMH